MKMPKFFDAEKILFYFRYFIFLFVNGIFIYKYSNRSLPAFHSVCLVFIYALIILGIIYLIKKITISEQVYKFAFFTITAVFFVFTVIINNMVDPYSLMTDRWNALETSIQALLDGRYPYNIVDFLGNESSNFPALILIGMPFYLIFGSVDYLQCFIFLLFALIIFKFFKNYRERILVLLLLILSPSYVYEIYTKSDLFSNFVIAVGAVLFIWKFYVKSSKLKYGYVAVIAAFLLLTRLPVLFPMIILLFRKFYFLPLKGKMIFMAVFLASAIPLLLWVFLPAESWEVIKNHNPFRLQSKQPIFLSMGFVALTVFLSFKVKGIRNVLDYSAVILFLSVLSTFVLLIAQYGIDAVFYQSGFDISYFNIAIPFIILSLPLKDYFGKEALSNI